MYTTINTQIIVCIQNYYHSCKSYVNTHISVHINKYNCMKKNIYSNFDHLLCKSQRFSVKINLFVIIIF